MTGWPGLLALILIWSAVGYRSWSLLRHPRGDTAWAWWRSLLALAGAVSLFYPPGYNAVYALTGIPNAAEVVGHWLILISGWQASAVLIFLAYGKEPAVAQRMLRRRGILVLATLVVATYFFSRIPADTNTTRFTTVYADAPFINHYWITYLVAVNVLQADIARLFMTYSFKSTRESLRIGLRVIAVGVLIGSLYWVHWIVFLVVQNSTGETPAWLDVWGSVAAVGAVLLVVIGSTIPVWGRRVGLKGPLTAWREFRALRQLKPLWQALTSELPDIALREPGDERLSYRLYRRKVEILDGMLALRPYRDPEVERQVRQRWQSQVTDVDDLDARVEAAMIKHALAERRAGTPAARAAAGPIQSAVREDVAWLCTVSKEFARLQRPGSEGR
ncbi:MAB_1171c family putative transporter [Micromonospora sp. NPDC048930]|uniref:MAB_1171c family putative transporter n=1 Tax=Micromonospora sp. NPDC048930 TaxID=3364261 RepID=UPI0037133AA1